MSDSSVTPAARVREPPPHNPATVVRHIAQEIKQPLSTVESIAHYLDLVLPRTEAKARRQLGKLREEVRHIQWILADAIHFLHAAPPQLHPMDLTETVAENFSEWCPEGRAGCTLLLEPGLPLVRLDLEMIQHLLRNITSFFYRISAPGRSIAIQTRVAGGEVLLEITSGALVFAPEDVEPLLEPFASRFPTGAGLALASARRIAEAHGARFEVASEPPHSLTVVVAFPAV
jgi:signal transduction histidine kinase